MTQTTKYSAQESLLKHQNNRHIMTMQIHTLQSHAQEQ